MTKSQIKIIDAAARAVNECVVIFAQLARDGKYPPQLEGHGWRFLVDVHAQLKALAACDANAAENSAAEKPAFIKSLGWGESWEERASRAEVQLAGCSMAALGAISDPAKPEDWGWSAAYQDVLELRRKYEALLSRLEHVDTYIAMRTGEGPGEVRVQDTFEYLRGRVEHWKDLTPIERVEERPDGYVFCDEAGNQHAFAKDIHEAHVWFDGFTALASLQSGKRIPVPPKSPPLGMADLAPSGPFTSSSNLPPKGTDLGAKKKSQCPGILIGTNSRCVLDEGHTGACSLTPANPVPPTSPRCAKFMPVGSGGFEPGARCVLDYRHIGPCSPVYPVPLSLCGKTGHGYPPCTFAKGHAGLCEYATPSADPYEFPPLQWEWFTYRGGGITVHSFSAGPVLCRWWGDGEEPAEAKLIAALKGKHLYYRHPSGQCLTCFEDGMSTNHILEPPPTAPDASVDPCLVSWCLKNCPALPDGTEVLLTNGDILCEACNKPTQDHETFGYRTGVIFERPYHGDQRAHAYRTCDGRYWHL